MRWASPPESDGAGRSQRQVVQADVEQEAQPLADFFQNLAGDLQLIIAQTLGLRHTVRALSGSICPYQRSVVARQLAGPGIRLDRSSAPSYSLDRQLADRHRQAFGPQRRRRRIGQGCSLMIRRDRTPASLLAGLVEAARDLARQALPRAHVTRRATAGAVPGEADALLAAAVEINMSRALGHLFPGRIEVELIVPRDMRPGSDSPTMSFFLRSSPQ